MNIKIVKGVFIMSDCIFCKIIDGSIPSTKIYEDDNVYAFMDVGPLSKGHTLLVPKEHVANVFEMSSELAAQSFLRSTENCKRD